MNINKKQEFTLDVFVSNDMSLFICFLKGPFALDDNDKLELTMSSNK